MKRTKRARYAILALLVLTGFLLLTVRGPVIADGVAFYLPIIICAMLAWRFLVFQKNRIRSYTFLPGAAGGLAGTLVWPTGILVGMMIAGTADPKIMPLFMFFAICFVASVLGGAVALILSMGFDGPHEQDELALTHRTPENDRSTIPTWYNKSVNRFRFKFPRLAIESMDA